MELRRELGSDVARPVTDQALNPPLAAAASLLRLPIALAAVVYVLMAVSGAKLLNDPDTCWHLVVGQWILQHGAVPHADMFSHTFLGQPWIAKEWLSQVLYAGAYAAAGWTGIVVLACVAIAAAFALLAHCLLERLAFIPALVLVTAALVLTAPHLVARPHVLALPIMVAWVAGLVRATDEGRAPSPLLLPLMVLWANLHGGFTFGLALMAPIGLEAVWNAAPAERKAMALRWLGFALGAVLAACVTPYGPESMLVTYRILSLGDALSSIGEWRPQDFSRLDAFEAVLLLGLGFALYRGVRLPPLRILLFLGLLHMALSHVRNGELLGLLAPLVLAAPLARQFGAAEPVVGGRARTDALAIAGMICGLAAATFIKMPAFTPSAKITPAVAVQKLKELNRPVLNDYDLGGYLIFAGVAPFIDGRTELYGEKFYMRYYRAVTLEDLDEFLRLLDEHAIGATLLTPSTPALKLLDRLPGWERVYADDSAVLHRRISAGPTTPVLR